MSPPGVFHNAQDRDTFWTIISFLDDRLAEQETIDWALKLKPEQRIERLAIKFLAERKANELPEPWSTAWRLIEESWLTGASEDQDRTAIYDVKRRIWAGEKSGKLVAAIVALVAPRLKVEALDDWRFIDTQRLRRPKKAQQVLSASLTSGDLIDLDVLDLAHREDVAFLRSLANALEAAINHGLDNARRLGWNEDHSFYLLGMLNRVYYTKSNSRKRGHSESDAFNKGIAPSVKLLYAVVERISDLDKAAAQNFVQRWKLERSPVHIRLWAAMSRNDKFVSASEVLNFLMALDDWQFWNLHEFPEIAELRAIRFNEFDHASQGRLTARLQKSPPRKNWPRKTDKDRVANARQYWACRELRRIEVAGGVLPVRAEKWLHTRLPRFCELERMEIDEGFLEGPEVKSRSSNPDNQYDEITGTTRLSALERALGIGRRSWDDDPAGRANDWIRQPGNASKVLADLKEASDDVEDFPRVWGHFCWAHRPGQDDDQRASNPNLEAEANHVLILMDKLSDATLSEVIEGICAWFDIWKSHIVNLSIALPIWLRLWPLAVEKTNDGREEIEDVDLSVSARVVDDDREPRDPDTVNSPVGKLVGVFIAACPRLGEASCAFAPCSMERKMRDTIIAVDGQSVLIAKYRMIQELPYFLRADREWAQKHLINPLRNENGASQKLWRAVGRRIHSTEVLKIIGEPMIERVNDRKLGRVTRSSLVLGLVFESLFSFHYQRDAAVPNPRIQQMLRTLDDEVRAEAANAIKDFVRDLSEDNSVNTLEEGVDCNKPSPAAALFRNAAAPFLRGVWPQERSLATPGISSALADLPATSDEAFAEAVETIERFLVPFNCWSMLDYGLDADKGISTSSTNLTMIDNEPKAEALLKLFDLTIGKSEGAVIPHDLTDALDQIREVSPKSVNSPIFRRLETVSRR